MPISCDEFRLHNDFAENFVTRGLSPLPVCVLDNKKVQNLKFISREKITLNFEHLKFY